MVDEKQRENISHSTKIKIYHPKMIIAYKTYEIR